MNPMRILLAPTTMQGDIYAFAVYLQQRQAQGAPIEVVVAVDDVERYRKEPIHSLIPFELPIWERSSLGFERRAKKFAPHFWVADNHLPKNRTFENLVYLWHGFGWKEQRADIEFRTVHAELAKLVGSVKESNPHFVHQCYGAFEKDHRVAFTQFHPENCMVMGNLYSDLLLSPPATRAQIAPFYPFRGGERKTVLLGFTWGFGEVFANWGEDEASLMQRLLDHLAEKDTNVIFRLHDRKRYDKKYLKMLESAASRYSNVLLKFKDVGRDNLCDVLMSDVIVSNFSGIVVYAYFTGAASVHIDPFAGSNGTTPLLRFSRGKPVVDPGASYQWKMPAEENGGLLARDKDALFAHLDRAIAEPTCCRDASAEFIRRYMETSQGDCCARLYRYLELWHGCGQKPSPDPVGSLCSRG